MAMKLIRIVKGPATGKYCLLETETGDIILPNGYKCKGGRLPWNAEWVVSKRKLPKWTKEYLESYKARKEYGRLK